MIEVDRCKCERSSIRGPKKLIFLVSMDVKRLQGEKRRTLKRDAKKLGGIKDNRCKNPAVLGYDSVSRLEVDVTVTIPSYLTPH